MIKESKVIGGIGEKKSNGGTQWFLQDRIYNGDISITIATCCNPYYLVDENSISNETKGKNEMEQLDMFEASLEDKIIKKPVKLISFFSGIESQLKALKFLGDKTGIPVESYKTCEWAYNNIIACNEIHNKDFTNYAEGLTKEQLIEYLDGNISTDYNSPCDVRKKPLKWLQNCYNSCKANHNLMNIMKVHGKDLEIKEKDKYEYILTYSFPCQDLSLAGKRAGMSVSQAEGGTRSGLLWEVERILKELKELDQLPQILLLENVPQVHSSKNIADFEKWLNSLNELGYKSFCKDLNAKKFGIPQNRNRCFVVSVLEENNYEFPKEFELELKLKDFLEKEVDEKFYLTERSLKGKLNSSFNCSKLENIMPKDGVVPTICARDYKDPKCVGVQCPSNDVVRLGGLHDKEGERHQAGSIYCENGLSPTLDTCSGGHSHPFIVDSNLKKEFCNNLIENGLVKENDVIRHSYTTSHMQKDSKGIGENNMSPTLDTRCDCLGAVTNDIITVGNYGNGHHAKNISSSEGIMPTVTTGNHGLGQAISNNLRIRKLTPKECMRLMAFQDKDVDSLSLSNSAIYHCAGDSICVNVLIGIFASMFGTNAEQSIKQYILTIKNDIDKQ